MKNIANEKINITNYLENTNIDMNIVNSMFEVLLEDSDLINNQKDYPVLFQRVKNQKTQKQDNQQYLYLDEEEKTIIKSIIAESIFVVAFISDIKVPSKIDFTGLMSFNNDHDLLFLEIKTYLIQELSEVPLLILNDENFDRQNYDMPDNYETIFRNYVIEYLNL